MFGIGKKVPGQRSNITLLITGFWALLGLFILIVGHLTIIFYIYGAMQNTDAVKTLADAIPVLGSTHLYVVAALAIALDIWIFHSHRQQRLQQDKR